MNSPGWRGGHVIEWKWYLTNTRESQVAFLRLFLPVMAKAADLSGFKEGKFQLPDGSERVSPK